jgi:dCMP deaminase
MNRLSWDEYFLKIADTVAERSTCLRRKVGAILVSDRRILSTGYNGAPKNLAHCSDAGCLRLALKIKYAAGFMLSRTRWCRQLFLVYRLLVQYSIQLTFPVLPVQKC